MTEQEQKKRNRRSDWFGSGPFNWFNETLFAAFPLVIVITAILAAILFPLFARVRENSRHKSVQSELELVAKSLTQYGKRHGKLPDEKDWFKAINIHGRRFSRAPLDSWKTPVKYKVVDNGKSAVIISAGRDRKFGSANDITVRIAPDK